MEVVINTAGLDINNDEFAEELRGDAGLMSNSFRRPCLERTSFVEVYR